MQATDILDRARDTMTIKRVFGEPFEQDGVTILPVARVSGGAGAGTGHEGESGGGGGFGMNATGLGVFEVRGGEATWKPAIDINRVIMGGQMLMVVLLLVIRSIAKARMTSHD
jgi:hypothetical protein